MPYISRCALDVICGELSVWCVHKTGPVYKHWLSESTVGFDDPRNCDSPCVAAIPIQYNSNLEIRCLSCGLRSVEIKANAKLILVWHMPFFLLVRKPKIIFRLWLLSYLHGLLTKCSRKCWFFICQRSFEVTTACELLYLPEVVAWEPNLRQV